MEGSTSGVDVAPLSEEGHELQLVPEEVTGDVQLLTSHNNNSVALQKGFGYNSGQATQQMAPSVDQDRLFAKPRHVSVLCGKAYPDRRKGPLAGPTCRYRIQNPLAR